MLMCGIVLVCSKLRFYFIASDTICIRMRAYDLHIVPQKRIETSFITILVPIGLHWYCFSNLFYLSHICFSMFLTFFCGCSYAPGWRTKNLHHRCAGQWCIQQNPSISKFERSSPTMSWEASGDCRVLVFRDGPWWQFPQPEWTFLSRILGTHIFHPLNRTIIIILPKKTGRYKMI